MNRRQFFFSGLFGVGAGLVATAAQASRPTSPRTMLACTGAHEPVESYLSYNTALAIGHRDDPMRAVVPCKKCGALFALPHGPILKESR